jgi:hypothetical protein
MKHEISPGTNIDDASLETSEIAKFYNAVVTFDFNGTACVCDPNKTVEENRLACRAALGLPAKDPPFQPITALDALEQWDKGEIVFTVEMGGLAPGYEQAIQILVFELIRDLGSKPLPDPKDRESWGDETVHRIDEACGGFSGAQVGAAKTLAFRAIRDGWAKMLESAPYNRRIMVSRSFPVAPPPPAPDPLQK